MFVFVLDISEILRARYDEQGLGQVSPFAPLDLVPFLRQGKKAATVITWTNITPPRPATRFHHPRRSSTAVPPRYTPETFSTCVRLGSVSGLRLSYGLV
jgi:hypothetical protein